MTLLQVKVDEKLKKAIEKKADTYGVPTSTLVRIVLVKSFLNEPGADSQAGNVFNAERDNRGKGIHIDQLIAAL